MDKPTTNMNIEIKVDEHDAVGRFSNFANITHTPEEFIVDFLFVNPVPPPGFGKLMSRVVMTPGHAKRILAALAENVRNYEEHFGAINVAQFPGGPDSVQ